MAIFSVNFEHCHDQTIDNNNQNFSKKLDYRVGDLITGNEPEEKELEFLKYLSAVIKIKQVVKKNHYNLAVELRQIYNQLDKVIKLLLVKLLLVINREMYL